MSKSLVSLVTGAASGLGRATATQMAKKYGPVVMLDLPESRGQEVANSLEGDVTFVPCDVSKEEDVMNALEVCQTKYGRLNVAVNCAGMARAFKICNPLRNNIVELDCINVVLQSNLIGTFNVSRLCSQMMYDNKPDENEQRGVIINTAGMAAHDGAHGQTMLAAAKAGIVALNLPMSRDLSPFGIRVVSISPSMFDTPLHSEACLTTEIRQFLMKTVPNLKRFGKTEEFVHMVQTIINNPYINGEDIKLSSAARTFSHMHYHLTKVESM